MRVTALALIAAMASAAGSGPSIAQEGQGFDAEGWVSDLNLTRQAMGSHYANLAWAVNEREAPLPQLFAVAEQRLRAARSDAEAREVFQRFEDYIGDGHLEFVWPAGTPSAPAGRSETDSQDTAPCRRLGFQADGRDGSAIATNLPGYRALSGDSGFPAGLVEIDGRRLGVVRIANLSPRAHPGACDTALAALSSAGSAPEALDPLLRAATDIVTDDLTRRLRDLRAAGATVLLVDLAGNGGGTEWVEVVSRLVTPRNLVSPRVGFPRHPHWIESFAGSERRLRQAAEGLTPEEGARLAAYADVFAEARRQADTPCDPAPLFDGAALNCDWLTTAPLYSSGPVAALDADLADKPWAGEVFTPLKYRFEPGVWDGPVIVLVDGATASASEQMAAMLQDNRAAVILGSPTRGAGCGHANGEIETRLPHSGARLRLPNCARLRADGRNEVSGVDPDVLIGFRDNDGPRRRIARLAQHLPQAVRRAETLSAAD